MSILVHLLLVFLVIFFTIIYPIVFIKSKINIFVKILNLIMLFVIINLMFTIINKNLKVYKSKICELINNDNTYNIIKNDYYL